MLHDKHKLVTRHYLHKFSCPCLLTRAVLYSLISSQLLGYDCILCIDIKKLEFEKLLRRSFSTFLSLVTKPVVQVIAPLLCQNTTPRQLTGGVYDGLMFQKIRILNGRGELAGGRQLEQQPRAHMANHSRKQKGILQKTVF